MRSLADPQYSALSASLCLITAAGSLPGSAEQANVSRSNPSPNFTPKPKVAANRLHIGPLLSRPARALSGGEIQRIALIQTLLCPASVLLRDEPLSAVDTALQSVVLDLLLEESAIGRRICLIAAHPATPKVPLEGTFLIEYGHLLS